MNCLLGNVVARLHLKQVYSKKAINCLSTLTQSEKAGDAESVTKPDWIPFDVARHGSFFQTPPHLQNQYLGDSLLRSYLHRNIPKEMMYTIEKDLVRFGERVAGELHSLSLDCERQPPKLVCQDAWGTRKDLLQTCSAWKKMHSVSAQEGLIAIAYEKEFAEWSRLYQVAKLYLYGPSSGLYSCPLAMTDGAAKTIQVLQLKEPQFNKAFEHLTSRDPDFFWTSGQWMTEKRGGSDVSNGTETVAVPQEDGTFRLYGYKWFTSALDASIALTLARVVDSNNMPGKTGLTMFYLETKDAQGDWNNIQSVRLKEKLGTRQLPTAELLLNGTIAHKMSEEGRGVAGITQMLTMTRLHNAIASVAGMRRVLSLSRDYSQKRSAFGQVICKYPLHMQTLARMEVETRGVFLLLFEVSKMLAREESGVASQEESLLIRIVMPILKLYTAKQAVSVVSEGLETFGGQGYMEDTGLPVMLRDAQVLPIWEGTTNVLSLDVLRSVAKTRGQVLHALASDIMKRLGRAGPQRELQEAKATVLHALQGISDFIQSNPDKLQVAARDLAFSIGRTYIGALVIEYASHAEATKQDVTTAERWCSMANMNCVSTNSAKGLYTSDATTEDYQLVMDGYQ